VRLTISIGAVRAAARHDNLDTLVEAADRCLYAAKCQGRDRVALVPHVLDARSRAPAEPAEPVTPMPASSPSPSLS